MKVGDVWIVTSSNNLGAVERDTELYVTQGAAESAATVFNQTKVYGRSDWVIVPLGEAIRQAIDEACSDATDEG